MRKIVQSHDFLPAAKKRKTNQTPLELRTIARSEKLPVIMAAYGSQHRFSLNTLRERGCLAHFIQDDLHGPRLLHPGEIAMLHGLMDRYFATADFTLAWKFLGNMIAPIHSLMTLQIALQVIPRFATIAKTINVFQTWSDHRLKTCQAILTKGIGGSFLRRLIWEEDLPLNNMLPLPTFFSTTARVFYLRANAGTFMVFMMSSESRMHLKIQWHSSHSQISQDHLSRPCNRLRHQRPKPFA
jgi:hypothetical protein